VLIGEVENRNAIDDQDVANLSRVQQALLKKNVVCVVMYATFKDSFSAEELAAIRAEVSRKAPIVTVNGASAPLMPLLLTHRDMSLPAMHNDHPWRWDKSGSGLGLVGTAIESCKRHLGLASYSFPSVGSGSPRSNGGPSGAPASEHVRKDREHR